MSQRSVLDDLGEEVTGIVSPVSLCMAITVLLVRLLNPEGTSSANTVLIASIAYKETTTDSAGKKFGGALLNALIFVGVVAGMTVVLFVLFKYGCYKLIFGYMGFAVFMIFFFITGALFIQVMQRINLHVDAFSLAYGLFNFSVVGTLGILFLPIPLLAKQCYLIWVGIIVAYIFTFIPEWTAWAILVFMAVYDIIAVLVPGGPLKALVELAIERRQELPALIYEARPTGGRPYVRGWGNRRPANEEEAAAQGAGAEQQAPQQQAPTARGPVAEGGGVPSLPASGQSTPATVRGLSNQVVLQVQPHPAQRDHHYENVTLTPVQNMRVESFSTTSAWSRGGRAVAEGSERGDWQALPATPNKSGGDVTPVRSSRVGTPDGSRQHDSSAAPSRHDSGQPLIPQGQSARADSYGGAAAHSGEAQANAPRPQSRLRPTAPTASQNGMLYEPNMGVRAQPPAIDPEALTEASHRARDRASNPGGPAVAGAGQGAAPPAAGGGAGGERRDGDDDDDLLPDSIKLGLGDFIFYSMLVGIASKHDMMTVFAAYIAIIAGLGLTLLCLAIFKKALPALPFSIALGVMFYFLTRLTLEPFIVPIATHYAFY